MDDRNDRDSMEMFLRYPPTRPSVVSSLLLPGSASVVLRCVGSRVWPDWPGGPRRRLPSARLPACVPPAPCTCPPTRRVGRSAFWRQHRARRRLTRGVFLNTFFPEQLKAELPGAFLRRGRRSATRFSLVGRAAASDAAALAGSPSRLPLGLEGRRKPGSTCAFHEAAPVDELFAPLRSDGPLDEPAVSWWQAQHAWSRRVAHLPPAHPREEPPAHQSSAPTACHVGASALAAALLLPALAARPLA